MKHSSLLVTVLALATVHGITGATDKIVIPTYFSIRSQGANLARQDSGMIDQRYACDIPACANYGSLNITTDYTRSFNGEEITHCLFATKNNPTITIAGSSVADRSATDWLADYFYLPTDFKSTVNFDPVIDNFLFEFNLFVGLEEWFDGFYLNFYAPLVHTRWKLGICETVELKGTASYVAGYFTPNALNRGQMLADFTSFVDGTSINPIVQTIPGMEVNTVFEELRNAKISPRFLTQTRIADVRMQIGWQFLRTCNAMIGTYIQIAAPTGMKPEGAFLFEPIVGNGHHWEVGIGFNGLYTLWCNKTETTRFRIFADGYATYLFDARQKRTFDLIDKPFSRYLLAERISAPIVHNLLGDGIAPTAQFKQEFAPVANLSNISVDVKAGPQVEALLMLNSVYGGWNVDIGYNFWYRGCETVLPRLLNSLELNSMWALKGDAFVYGFLGAADAPLPQGYPIPLSATEIDATIYSGTNFPVGGTDKDGARRNARIDNPANATAGASNTLLLFDPTVVNNQTNQIKTSIQPIFPQASDINLCDASHTGLSHKAFANISYVWSTCNGWMPYFGVGGEAEFGQSDWCVPCEDHCSRCSISQWSIWFKGGFSY